MKLKSTGQNVFSYPWTGDSGCCPWDEKKYLRVLIPLTHRSRKGNLLKDEIVRREQLDK